MVGQLRLSARADEGGGLREIPSPRRQRLHHGAIDAILSGGHAPDADVIAAAGHALEAGPATDAAAAADLVERAAHLAADSFGYDVAIRLAEARLPLLRRFAEPDEQARADVDVARLRLRSGRGYDRVVELLERALATYRTSTWCSPTTSARTRPPAATGRARPAEAPVVGVPITPRATAATSRWTAPGAGTTETTLATSTSAAHRPTMRRTGMTGPQRADRSTKAR